MVILYLGQYQCKSQIKLIGSLLEDQQIITFVPDGFQEYGFIAPVNGDFG